MGLLEVPPGEKGAVDPVPATLGILTFNNRATLEATLRSASNFAEILVCDGGSTDGTREMAASFGCMLINQDKKYLDSMGRLVNMTGLREQMVAAAENDWVFFLDADELATPGLVDEMRQVTVGPRRHGAYQVPRLYVVDGEIIRCASNYPSYQTRLVHRAAISRYAGIIHDHPVLKSGETIGDLHEAELVPQPPLRELWPKWISYMRLEEVGKLGLSRSEWVDEVLRPEYKTIKWLAYRIVKVRRTCQGSRQPMRYELGRIAYEMGVVFYTGRRFLGLGKADSNKAWR